MGECANCGRDDTRPYTLVLDSGHRLEDRDLCRHCRAFFDESRRVEVLEAPVLLRGGPGAVEEAEE